MVLMFLALHDLSQRLQLQGKVQGWETCRRKECGKVRGRQEAGRIGEEGIGDEVEVKAVCVNHTCLRRG